MKKLFSIILALALLLPPFFAAAPRAQADGPLVITKSPYGETVNEGEDAPFTARADNYSALVWLIVSPDGSTVYEDREAEAAFPGLEMTGIGGEELELHSVPLTMNGWYVQARFLDSDGDAFLTERAQITVLQGIVPSPLVTVKSGGARLNPGESRTLAVEAASPSGDELKYQWYRSDSPARGSGEPIPGATRPEYTPPEVSGQLFYYVGVWCVRGRDASTPILTAPAAIVYSAPAESSAPAETPVPTPAPTTPPNRGGPNPLIDGSSAIFTAVATLLILTLLAASVMALALHTIRRKQRRAEKARDGVR